MKITVKKIATITALLVCMIGSKSVFAASQDECAIWLCLPSGFGPSECSDPYKAMEDRIEDLKSPLPSWSSCSSDGSNEGLSYNYGRATYVSEYTECFGTHFNEECTTYGGGYVRGTWCNVDREGDRTPKHCSGNYYWTEIFTNNSQIGDTYYFRK